MKGSLQKKKKDGQEVVAIGMEENGDC